MHDVSDFHCVTRWSQLDMDWGAVRVQVTIGHTAWETSIFPHAKLDAYILPIKMDVRKKEKIAAEDNVKVTLKINL